MVKQYLEKIQDNLFSKKLEISNYIIDLNNQYKETIEMIKLLEEVDDPTFDAFTPRQVNNFNRSKVAELKENQIYLLNQIDVKKQELSQIELEIIEINNVIKIENFNIHNIKVLSEKIEKCYDSMTLENCQQKKAFDEMRKVTDEILNNI